MASFGSSNQPVRYTAPPMLKYLRYALPTVCFAANVGCLASWGWTVAFRGEEFRAIYYSPTLTPFAAVACGQIHTGLGRGKTPPPGISAGLSLRWHEMGAGPKAFYQTVVQKSGHFSTYYKSVLFPAWFLAVVFATAAIAFVKVTRFSLRTAIIATTVVAGMLGMAVFCSTE